MVKLTITDWKEGNQGYFPLVPPITLHSFLGKVEARYFGADQLALLGGPSVAEHMCIPASPDGNRALRAASTEWEVAQNKSSSTILALQFRGPRILSSWLFG